MNEHLSRRNLIQRLALGIGALFTKIGFASPAGAPGCAATGNGAPQSGSSDRSTWPGRVSGYIRPDTIEVIHREFELVVVGGGMSGLCAAISAARNGVQVALVHERPTLGGNTSSEVRNIIEDTCWFTTWCRETGILDELYIEDRACNWVPYTVGRMNSQWDLVLYEWAQRERNLTLFLNTTMREVEMADENHILAIHAAQLGTEKDFIIRAPLFIDCTGDGVLIYRSGAQFRWGQEARSEYDEPSAPEQASTDGMGNTIFFTALDAGHPVPFKCPDWAAEFATEADLTDRHHRFSSGFSSGYPWIEVAYPMHWIRDQEVIRDVLLRQALGTWDHLKNRCTDAGVRDSGRNHALEFVGFWPYKRESRRLLGDYILREQDIRDPSVHPDDIAYGVWGIDIHPPGGVLKRHVAPWADFVTKSDFDEWATLPYGIPLRSCYSRNVVNLMAAGRPIGATYVAFSSSRVIATGAITGQGVGVAAALCKKYGCGPRQVTESHAQELQQLLLRQDCSMPGVENRDPLDLARTATVTASSECLLSFPEGGELHPANLPLAQIFPVSSDRIERIELLLKSSASSGVAVRLGLRKAAHVWDFRAETDVATASAWIPGGHQGYVAFDFQVRTDPGSLYYIHMEPHPQLAWSLWTDPAGGSSLVPVGVTPADRPGAKRWRPLTGASAGRAFTMRVTPKQHAYPAANVIRGTNRPDRWTNIWISDSAHALPAWIELNLGKPVKFNLVQITFDDNINVRSRQPLFRYPECVKSYEVEVHASGQWKTVAEAHDNYHRRAVHVFSRVIADRLRIRINETNGSATARIYEVRIYDETDSIQSAESTAEVIHNKILREFRTVPSQTL